MNPETLSWASYIGSFTSAMLTGPVLVFRRGLEKAAPWQRVGWTVLFIAQATMATLGWVLDIEGLKWGPSLMVLAATINFTYQTRMLRRARRGNANQD